MNGRHARNLALLALLLAPALTLAQTRRDRADGQYGYAGGGAMGPAIGTLGGGLMVGLDIPPSGLDVGPRFTGELMYGAAQLAPQLRLDLGGRLAYAFHSHSNDNFPGSAWLLDVVPELRLILDVTPKLAIYGDLGVGFAIIRDSFDGGGSATATEATFQLTVPGLSYALSPSLNLLAELRFNFYTRSGDGTFITIPNIGLQWH